MGPFANGRNSSKQSSTSSSENPAPRRSSGAIRGRQATPSTKSAVASSARVRASANGYVGQRRFEVDPRPVEVRGPLRETAVDARDVVEAVERPEARRGVFSPLRNAAGVDHRRRPPSRSTRGGNGVVAALSGDDSGERSPYSPRYHPSASLSYTCSVRSTIGVVRDLGGRVRGRRYCWSASRSTRSSESASAGSTSSRTARKRGNRSA